MLPTTSESVISEEKILLNDREDFVRQRKVLMDKAAERGEKRQHNKGKLTARERLETLLDPGSFVEIGQFTGGNVFAGFLGAAVITGFGDIQGRKVAVYAQDFAVQGGTLGEIEGQKILRLMDSAMELRIPVIGLLDSGGARIQEGVVALSQYGRLFKKTCRASGLIPQISVILGPCAGGAVYCPALTDIIVMTKENSHMFVTGPEVVFATTGEAVSFEELGGGQVHNIHSGVAHYLADDEDQALAYVRSLLDYLPSSCHEEPPRYGWEPNGEDTLITQRIGTIVPASSKSAYDIVEVIECLVDNGEFVQIQELFAPSVVVGLACIEGHSIGIVANQPACDAGTLDVNASEKAARFVNFCDAFNLPVLTLVDVPGYRPGTEQEQAGIIRRGAKLITAYANATVPMVTVIIRKAYGGAYIVMGSKSIGADINYAWPDAQIAVLGADGAISILGRRELAVAKERGEDVAKLRQKMVEEYNVKTVNPALSVASGELDALITPAQTRQEVARAFAVLRSKNREFTGAKRHDNSPL